MRDILYINMKMEAKIWCECEVMSVLSPQAHAK